MFWIWIFSAISMLGTGYVAFTTSSNNDTLIHATFILSAAVFVAGCLWCLVRGLVIMTERRAIDERDQFDKRA